MNILGVFRHMKKKVLLSISLTLFLVITTGCTDSRKTEDINEIISYVYSEDSDNTNQGNDISSDYIVDDSQDSSEMVDLFGCKAEKIDSNITPRRLTEHYVSAYNKCKNDGCTPVIIVLDDILEEMIESNYKQYDTPEDYREAMLSGDTSSGKEYFEMAYEELEQAFADDDMGILEQSDREFENLIETGIPQNEYLGAMNFVQGVNDGDIYIVYVPTSSPWEIFAWLPFGNWNACPNTPELLLQCRYWYEEYGAMPAYISHDTLEFYLFEPIDSKDKAQEIAKEHCIFCLDILGMGGLNYEAAMIYNSNIWQFWWD